MWYLTVQETRGGPMKLDQQVMERRVNWLNSIRDWQQEFVGSLSAREFVDCITDDLLGQGVFVFTPSGAVMRLPKVCNSLICPRVKMFRYRSYSALSIAASGMLVSLLNSSVNDNCVFAIKVSP